MAQIDDRVLDRVIEALGDSPLVDELREEMRPASNRAQEITISIPERHAAHVADALMIGATSQMMKQGRDANFHFLQQLEDKVDTIVPNVIKDHFRSADIPRVLHLLTLEDVTLTTESRGFSYCRVLVEGTDPDTGRSTRSSTWNEVAHEEAESLVSQLREIHDRLAPMPGTDDDVVPAGPKM